MQTLVKEVWELHVMKTWNKICVKMVIDTRKLWSTTENIFKKSSLIDFFSFQLVAFVLFCANMFYTLIHVWALQGVNLQSMLSSVSRFY